MEGVEGEILQLVFDPGREVPGVRGGELEKAGVWKESEQRLVGLSLMSSGEETGVGLDGSALS